MKFFLVTAASHLDALDALLDTYGEIGDVLPNMGKFEQLYQRYPAISTVLERYMCHVLEFHSQALAVFDRQGKFSVRVNHKI
jgi:hypothetical protein